MLSTIIPFTRLGTMGQSYALPLPVTSKHIQRGGNKYFRVASVSMQGWRRCVPVLTPLFVMAHQMVWKWSAMGMEVQ